MRIHSTIRKTSVSGRSTGSRLRRVVVSYLAGASLSVFAPDAAASDALQCFKIADRPSESTGGDLATRGTGTNSGTIEIAAGRTLKAKSGFVQDGAGTLAIDIAGTSSFGKVTVTGTAALAGTLDVTLSGGFSPSIGDTFAVMTFGSKSGDFATVTGLDIGGGKRFDRTFTATQMILEVVPQ